MTPDERTNGGSPATSTTKPTDESANGDRVERLERRLLRERTARLEAEQIAENGMRSLWKANRDLEQRVAARTAELERSLADARIAAAAKERFLADLGHDLSTPLHNVLGLLELVDATPLERLDRDRLDDVGAHARRLADLLQSLVDLAGADSPPALHDMVDRQANTWLDTVVDAWTRPAAQRAQLLVPSVNSVQATTTCDWGRLRRALDAVLSNVVVHASAGSVHVDMVVDDESVRIRVADNGPGLLAEIASAPSEPFVSAGPSAGSGVGLAIAERALRSAGGELVVNGAGDHTVVEVSLPVHRR